MTEHQIERAVERRIDTLDAAFLDGWYTQNEYDRHMAAIRAWADEQYKRRAVRNTLAS